MKKNWYERPTVKQLLVSEEDLMQSLSNPGGNVDGPNVLTKDDLFDSWDDEASTAHKSVWDD
ncbi:MAG: hypothetical protein IJV27_02325 [Prevotella sp.]|nr:hypothetical protein [Prevotella sp.]